MDDGARLNRFDTLVADAVAHHKAGRLAEAETAYRAALAIAPGHPSVTHNLGVVYASKGELDVALSCFDMVVAANSTYASAHYNRAVALQSLGRPREAIAAFAKTCALEPGHYDAHRALGFALLAQGDRGRSLDHFARTYELRRGEDRSGMAATSLGFATRAKLRHDADQFRYLGTRRRDGKRFEMMARSYDAVGDGFAEAATKLDADQLETIGEDYNTAIHISPAPEVPDGAINPLLDAGAITQRFGDGNGGAVWFDDLLAPPALAGLRRYLLESTIWHGFDHIGGFVASYLEDGLACPLLLQIADELRARFPDLLGRHPLSQAWAFKGLEAQAEVEAHADDGAISLNFWVTPNEANRDPTRGGLLICRAPPPPAWRISGYDADKAEIAAFLDSHRDATLAVPYGDNRAALFESRLFHRSDAPLFATDYASHRINVTLLFGRHGT